MNHIKTPRGTLLFAVSWLFAICLSANAFAAERVSGKTAYNVIYNNGTGAFLQIGGKNWVEKNNRGTNTFQETGRDQWTVYLARGSVRVKLDLWTLKVSYDAGNGRYSKIYSITDANEDIGWSVSQVLHSGDGAFVQTGNSAWVQYQPGKINHFTEVFRDRWSVYMRSNDNGRNVQLDLYTRQVKDRNTQQELHKIIAESSSDGSGCISWYKGDSISRFASGFGASANYQLYARCESGGAAIGGYAGSDIWLFNKRFQAAKVEAKVKSNYANFKIKALGNVIINYSMEEPVSFMIPVYGPKVSKSFSIAGIIGFNVDAYAGIMAGVKELGPIVGATRKSLILGLSGEPFVLAGAKAAGNVGFFLAGIWVDSSLTLAHVGFPSELAMWLNSSGQVTDLWGTSSLTATLLSDGRLAAGGYVGLVIPPFIRETTEVTFFDINVPTAWSKTVKLL